MQKLFSIIGLCLTLAACNHSGTSTNTTVLTANLDYVSTSLGYRNSGALSAGKLFLWDLDTNRLIDLRTPIILQTLNTTAPTTLTAAQVQGVDFSIAGSVENIVDGNLSSSFAKNFSFSVENAERENNHKIFDAISTAYRSLGDNRESAWHIDDVKRNLGRYRFVLTVDPVFATKETLSLVNDATTQGALSAFSVDIGEFKINVPNNTNGSCSGKRAQCFVGLAVLDIVFKDNKFLDYRISINFPEEKLSDALRSL